MKIIFIAGVHGVGKGVIADLITKKYQLEAYSSSSLIKSEKKAKVDINKIVQDPSENQDFLSLAINKLTPNSSAILLDGHFCLNTENGIFKVPTSTFEALDLEAIFLIKEAPRVIHERLLKRDGEAMNLELIENLQKEEVIQAGIISSNLCIPLIVSDKGSTQYIDKYLEKYIN